MHSYSKILPKAQKRFSLRSGFRNALATIHYFSLERPLPPSEKITLFTCNIFPPNVIVWHHLVRKYFGDQVDTFIFDCSGNLDPTLVPDARVHKYINAMHPTKIDSFLKRSARNRKIVWICDDDVFPISEKSVEILQREFADPNTASVSLRPRTWWHFEIGGKDYEPSGSYCIALNREIFIGKEHLSAQPANNNMHPKNMNKSSTRYDTLDKANEILLQKGYKCVIVPKEERDACMCGFDGTSIAALLLSYFKSPEETLSYFQDVDDRAWQGNTLPRNLNALLAAWELQDIYTRIIGTPYTLPTMPPKEELQAIAEHAKPFLTDGRNFDEVYERSEKLQKAIFN